MWQFNLLLIDKECKNPQNKLGKVHWISLLPFVVWVFLTHLFYFHDLWAYSVGCAYRRSDQMVAANQLETEAFIIPKHNFSLCSGSHRKDFSVYTTHTSELNIYPSVWKWEHPAPSTFTKTKGCFWKALSTVQRPWPIRHQADNFLLNLQSPLYSLKRQTW